MPPAHWLFTTSDRPLHSNLGLPPTPVTLAHSALSDAAMLSAMRCSGLWSSGAGVNCCPVIFSYSRMYLRPAPRYARWGQHSMIAANCMLKGKTPGLPLATHGTLAVRQTTVSAG